MRLFDPSNSSSIWSSILVYVSFTVRYGSLLVLIPFYGRILGAHEYGIVISAMSLMNIVWMIVNYGFSLIGMRDIARSRNFYEIKLVVEAHISGRIVMLILGVCMGYGLIYLTTGLGERIIFYSCFIILGCMNAFNFGWYYQGRQAYKTSVALEILPLFVNLFVVLSFVRGPNDSIYVPVSLLIGSTVSVTIGFSILLYQVGRIKICLIKGTRLVISAWPAFLLNLNLSITSSSSTMMVARFGTPVEAAFFSIAERVLSISASFFQPTSQIVLPLIASNNVGEDRWRITRLSMFGQFAFSLIIICVVLLFSKYILYIIFGINDIMAVETMNIMIISLPFISITHAVNIYYLVENGRWRVLIWTGSISNLLNFLPMAFLVELFGSVGGSYCRFVSEFAAATISISILVKNRRKISR